MSFFDQPWERGEKPYYINELGFEWYVDKELTRFALKDDYLWGGGKHNGLKEFCVFLLRRKDDVTYLMIGKNQLVVDADDSYVGMWNKIQQLKILFTFMDADEQQQYIEQLKYNHSVQKFLAE